MGKTRDDIGNKELQRQARERFHLAERLEAEYMRSLRQLTRHIEQIVKGMAPDGTVRNSMDIQTALTRYSEAIEPWARSVASKMVYRIADKNASAWSKLGNEIGRSLKKELNDAPTGMILQSFLNEQVRLIKSIPQDAAQRVHDMTLQGLITGKRHDAIAKEILKTGEVSRSKAQLIARTEIARTSNGLTMARATHIGVTHYEWVTVGDGDVRKSHKEMNGAVIPFDTPPEVEPGKRYHAGMFPNCRCYMRPIITNPEEI